MASYGFISYDPSQKEFICKDEWNLKHLVRIKKALQTLPIPPESTIINGESIAKMDTSGAFLLSIWLKKCEKDNIKIELINFSPRHLKLLSVVYKHTERDKTLPEIKRLSWIANFGKETISKLVEFRDFLTFTGHLTIESLRIFRHPSHFRFDALINVIERCGNNALPIIALLSLMIGIVITYLTGLKLKEFGANIFIVDLIGFAVLREFGPLITAIMVAGRTGSAFTAQLGIMKINQEIDALNTMGVTPAELLILPRILGLIIALPLLTIWADIFGVLGGMIMSNNMLDISWEAFLQRFQREVPLRALLIGIGKAPVFALIIAGIGCFQGMKVARTANSLGERTTKSVVWSIFYIIVVDAIFSIIFKKLKL